MSTTILQAHLESVPLVPTSALTSLSAQTTEASLRVSLTCGHDTIFTTILYPHLGIVEFQDPASLIEHYLRKKGATTATIVARFGTEALAINCIYCEYELPAGHDFSASFLTLLPALRVHDGSVVHIDADSLAALEAISVTAVGTDAAGSLKSFHLTDPSPVAISYGRATLDISQMIARVKASSGITRIHCFTASSGARQKSLFLVSDPSFLTFRFRNCFNAPETVDISGTSVMKTEVSRQLAICQLRSRQYDYVTDRTYVHTTGPLTRMEAAALSQLVESRDTAILLSGTEYPVLITDHTAEVSDDDSAQNTFKFTWRFASRRPRLFGATLSPLLDESLNIFTGQFSLEFQ